MTDPQGNAGLVVTTSNDNPNLINGITVAGTTPNFTLAITTKTGITGTAVVTVKVADSLGNFTTRAFKVVVTPSPYTLSVETLAGRTVAGAPTGFTDGTGSAATFTDPRGATADNRGLIYILDKNLIRSISSAGVVTTLAGATTRTTRVDGVGSAAGIVATGSSEYAASAVSPDNNWLYFLNGGWLRRMGINPSDSANYLNVTSLVAPTPSAVATVGGGLVFSADGNSIFLAPNTNGGAIKIQKIDLTTNPVTISNLALDGNPNNTILPAFMTKGPNNTAYIITHPNAAFGTAGYSNKFLSLNLATGTITALAQNPFVADTTLVYGGVYNPVTNELLVKNGSVAPGSLMVPRAHSSLRCWRAPPPTSMSTVLVPPSYPPTRSPLRTASITYPKAAMASPLPPTSVR